MKWKAENVNPVFIKINYILLTKVLVKKYSMIVIGAALYTSVLKMMLNERANEQQQTTKFFLNSWTKLSILIVKVNLIKE